MSLAVIRRAGRTSGTRVKLYTIPYSAGGPGAFSKTFASITVAAGDRLVITALTEDISAKATSVTTTSGTAAISAWTIAQDEATSGHAGHTSLTATVTAGGTAVITVNYASSASVVHVYTALMVATGAGGTVVSEAENARQVTYTPSAGSTLVAVTADFAAGASAGATFTPAGYTVDERETDGTDQQATAGTFLSVYTAHWNNVPASSQAYGVATPSSGTFSTHLVEFTAAPTAPLAVWNAAYANRANGLARVVNVGDSVTEGQGSLARSNRWIDKAAATLRGSTVGQIYIPGGYNVYSPDTTWGTVGIATSGGSVENWAANLGYRHMSLYNVGNSVTFTVTGTSVDIWYTTNGGTFTYAVDGGATTTVNTAGTFHTENRVQGVSLGASGSHTVTITCTSAAGAFIEGLTVYNGDAVSGVHFFDSGHTGYKVSDFLADSTEFLHTLNAAGPDLVTIMLGLNDASSITASAFQADLTSLVGKVKTLAKVPSVLLVAAYCPSSITPTTWATYVAAMSAVATTYGCGFLDLSAVMPQATTSGTGFYRTDGLHPNDSGHAEIANRVAAAIAPASTPHGGSTASTTTSLQGAGRKATKAGSLSATTAAVAGAGRKTAASGSTAPVAAGTIGGGRKTSRAGVPAETAVTAAGAGAKAARGGSLAAAATTASGAGRKTVEDGSTSSTTVVATGAGRKSAGTGSTAAVAAASAGAGAKQAHGGSAASCAATALAGGRKATRAGTTSSVTAGIIGAGSKAVENGSTAAVTVTAAGGGHPVVAGSGGSTATVTIGTAGSGRKTARGGSTAGVAVVTTGSGRKTSTAGSASAVAVTATGGGHAVPASSGGSIAPITVTITGAGRKTARGGSMAATGTSTAASGAKTTGQGSTATSTTYATAGGHAEHRMGSLAQVQIMTVSVPIEGRDITVSGSLPDRRWAATLPPGRYAATLPSRRWTGGLP